MKSTFLILCLFLIVYIPLFSTTKNETLSLSITQINSIGERIYQNECSKKKDNLVHWNEGEEFLSLGIGHFIWFPKDSLSPFKERFPLLVNYYRLNEIQLPKIIAENKNCPWNNREDFLKNQKDSEVEDVRQFLFETKALQAQFMAERLILALPGLVANLSSEEQNTITQKFNSLAESSAGLYALLDYVNFKGEGLSTTERYQGQGWGLLQVLHEMRATDDPVLSFQEAAKNVLKRRVELSPPARLEKRWLQGWFNRIDTYSQSTRLE